MQFIAHDGHWQPMYDLAEGWAIRVDINSCQIVRMVGPFKPSVQDCRQVQQLLSSPTVVGFQRGCETALACSTQSDRSAYALLAGCSCLKHVHFAARKDTRKKHKQIELPSAGVQQLAMVVQSGA
jgi:hypothetical protein